jgi:protein-S-isoprenylcysteine O-methyltransferase Ste14
LNWYGTARVANSGAGRAFFVLGLDTRSSIVWIPAGVASSFGRQRGRLLPKDNATAKTPMPKYLGALTIVLLLAMVLTRVLLLKRQRISAMKFGVIDKTDFLIPPFTFFFMSCSPRLSIGRTSARASFSFPSRPHWIGVMFCFAGLAALLWSLVSFGRSFRVGIDTDRPDALIVDGIFAFSRNPIYVAFAIILLGEFLIFANWISLIYLVAAVLLMHRQVLREEAYLKTHYGPAYEQYRHRVRRYL